MFSHSLNLYTSLNCDAKFHIHEICKKQNCFLFTLLNFLSKSLWNIILCFVLYGCEMWYLTWRERLSKTVFENRVLKNIFGHKRGDVSGEWRRLHNEELYDLYCSPNIARVIKSEE